MSNRDDVVRPDEEVRLPEIDPASGGIEVGSAQNDEERIAVALELRPLVGAGRVLDGEVVERELLLDLRKHCVVRLVEPDPDEPARLLQDLADIGDRHLPDPEAARVRHAVHHAVHARPSRASVARPPSKRYASGPVSAAPAPAIVLPHPAVAIAPRAKSAGHTTTTAAPAGPPGTRHGRFIAGSVARNLTNAASSISSRCSGRSTP